VAHSKQPAPAQRVESPRLRLALVVALVFLPAVWSAQLRAASGSRCARRRRNRPRPIRHRSCSPFSRRVAHSRIPHHPLTNQSCRRSRLLFQPAMLPETRSVAALDTSRKRRPRRHQWRRWFPSRRCRRWRLASVDCVLKTTRLRWRSRHGWSRSPASQPLHFLLTTAVRRLRTAHEIRASLPGSTLRAALSGGVLGSEAACCGRSVLQIGARRRAC